MPISDIHDGAQAFAPSAMAVAPIMVCYPILPVVAPATIAGGAAWTNLIICNGWKSISVGAKLSVTGSITIQRWLDAAGTIPVGALITVALTAGISNWATVNDGVTFASVSVVVNNTTGGPGNLTLTSILLGAA